jgi:hypothetical protein
MDIYTIARCTSHAGLKAWELVFTRDRVVLVRKSGAEALRIGAAGGIGGTTGPAGAALAHRALAKGAAKRKEQLDTVLQTEGISQLAAQPDNLVIRWEEIVEILLKDVLLGAPELRIVLRDGTKWRFGLYDSQKAAAHVEALRTLFGGLVRYK